jgi:hypothetical protein
MCYPSVTRLCHHSHVASILRLGASVAIVLALIPGTVASSAGSGLHGVVRKGPTTPVCRAGVPCEAPAHVTLSFSTARPGGGSFRFYWRRTDKMGRYRISLPPGSYTVSTGQKPGNGSHIKPRAVHVRAGHWDRIDFFVDTGIR